MMGFSLKNIKNKLNTGTGMSLLFSGGQLISNLLRMLSGFLTAKFTTPLLLGTFNGIGNIQGYAPIANLGVSNGLNRELPFHLGSSNVGKANQLTEAAHLWTIIIGLISFAGFIIYSLYLLFIGENEQSIIWFTFGISTFFLIYNNNYLAILFRTNKDFNKLSLINIVIASGNLLLIVPIYFYQTYGLCLRTILVSILEFVLLFYWRPLKINPKWNWESIKELMKVGIPIYIVGQIYLLWGVIQNTVIFKLAGAEKFGLYALALMIYGTLSLIPNSIAQVAYPQMAFAHGQGKSVKEILKIAWKPFLYSTLIEIPVIITAYFVFPYVVKLFLPKYTQGIDAGLWMMLVAFVMNFNSFNTIFIVLKKLREYLFSIIIGIIANIVIIYLLVDYNNIDLTIFPKAFLGGRLIFTFSSLAFIFKMTYKNKK
jgi:O-antigen/teichoic acid export membrane protein